MNYCSKCGNKLNNEMICDKCNTNVEVDNNNDEKYISKQKKSKILGIISLILALIPWLLFIYIFISVAGDDEGGAIFLAFGPLIYFYYIGIPISVSSLVCSLISSRYNKNMIAIISDVFNVIPLVISMFVAVMHIINLL